MRSLVVREHARIRRWTGVGAAPTDEWPHQLEATLFDRLKRYDQRGRAESERVFTWGDGTAQAGHWVGVIQLPGLEVEILPKVDGDESGAAPDKARKDANTQTRQNILYMLSVAGDVPLRSRDLARLTSRRAPLSETLAAIFADRLLTELLRGPERAYVTREENLRQFKGKLLVSGQIRHNVANRERFYCRFEELRDDTPMNRIFRASCRYLLDATHSPATQDSLRHCLLLLDEVSDVVTHDAAFDQVPFTRQNERFADVFRFCRLILSGRSPTVEAGKSRSFSLLFNMDVVFERFIAGFLQQRVMHTLEGLTLFPQARRHQEHLLAESDRGVMPLKPDLLIEDSAKRRLVIDTKWKRLDVGKWRSGAAGADLYQLYAYTRRYAARRSILLYPKAAGLQPRDLTVLGTDNTPSGEEIWLRFVDLHRNLHEEAGRVALANWLRQLIVDGLSDPHEAVAA